MSGTAFVFTRTPETSSWTNRAALTASDGAVDDQCGFSVDILAGDLIVVGSLFDDENGVEASIYDMNLL